MAKKVILKLKNINYSGSSIGNDIKLEVNILGKELSVSKKIKVNTIGSLDSLIGQFSTENKTFESNIKLRLIEDDPIFDDIGNLESKITIDTDQSKQEFSYEVKVKESGILKSKLAIFSIVLISEVVELEKCLSETHDGWLLVKIKGIEGEKSLPSFLGVHLTNSDNKRDYFLILEGFYKGKSGSVAKKSDGSSYLEQVLLERRPVELVYSISKKSFVLEGQEYDVDDDPANLFEIGTYDIEIPDAPHELGRPYLNRSRFALIWFHIGHDPREDKFLHTGSVSAGCVSMIEVEKWTEVCKKLLIARKDDISIGVLRVVK